MLELAQKTTKVKIFAEPIILMLSINLESELAKDFLVNTSNLILDQLAEKFGNLKDLEFNEPIQNLQKNAWYERFFNYSIQIRHSKLQNSSLVHTISSDEPFYLSATFSILLPSIQFNDKFSIGLMKEIQPKAKATTNELAREWLNMFLQLLKQELKSEIINLELRIENFKAYVPETQMRGSYLKTLLGMYNAHTALSILKENL